MFTGYTIGSNPRLCSTHKPKLGKNGGKLVGFGTFNFKTRFLVNHLTLGFTCWVDFRKGIPFNGLRNFTVIHVVNLPAKRGVGLPFWTEWVTFPFSFLGIPRKQSAFSIKGFGCRKGLRNDRFCSKFNPRKGIGPNAVPLALKFPRERVYFHSWFTGKLGQFPS